MEEETKDSNASTSQEQETPRTAKNTVTVEDAGPCKKKVSIEVPEESIKEAIDEQYKELGR